MKVHWTERAKRRLRLLHNHIANDSPIIAPQVIERLVRRSMQIGDMPYAGRAVPEYQREDVREILERPYRILYHIKRDRVDIIHVGGTAGLEGKDHAARRLRSSSESRKPAALITASSVESRGLPFGESAR